MFQLQQSLIIAALLIALVLPGQASRIKDLTKISGQRDNQLVGYGLVVGLAGDGDSQQAEYTVKSIANMLERFGVSVDPDDLRSNNVAAVMVTADIDAFVQSGSRIDVVVSSIGDADSLSGGVLLQTPLIGGDSKVYAVAQGSLLLGGFSVGGGDGDGSSVQKNHPTVARLPGGAIMEQNINSNIFQNGAVTFLLENPDYASAVMMEEEINRYFPGSAKAVSAQNLEVKIPEEYKGSETTFVASVESIQVETDITARVVMDERTGTIVATSDVRLSPVAVSHGSITVSVAKTPVISQPRAFSDGETVQSNITEIDIVEVRGGFSALDRAPTLSDLTTSLNSLGVSSRDMMAILHSLKSAGALHAEIIIE